MEHGTAHARATLADGHDFVVWTTNQAKYIHAIPELLTSAGGSHNVEATSAGALVPLAKLPPSGLHRGTIAEVREERCGPHATGSKHGKDDLEATN